MTHLDRLVEWDQLDLRIRGSKVQRIASELLRQKQLPLSDLRLDFLEGKVLVSARVQKGFAIPVSFSISTIAIVGGKTVHVPLENVSTFGLVPIPKFLFRFIGERPLPEGLTLNTETLTLTVSLDRLLPTFIDLTVEAIRIIPGGLAVRLGSGGADLPPNFL